MVSVGVARLHRWQAMYSTARASPVDYTGAGRIYIYMLYICTHIILSYMYVHTHYCFVAFLVLYLSVSIYRYIYIQVHIIDPAFSNASSHARCPSRSHLPCTERLS